LGALYAVFIIFIQNTLGSVTMDLGWLAVGAGMGLLLGSLIYGRIGKHFPLKAVLNISLIGASFYLIFFVIFLKYHPLKLFALFSCVLLGLFASPLVIGVNTLIHNGSENDFWGRIFSSLEVVIHFGFIVFMFIASFLADTFSPFTIILSVGIIIAFFSLFNFIKERCLK
jgi:MFS family permease